MVARKGTKGTKATTKGKVVASKGRKGAVKGKKRVAKGRKVFNDHAGKELQVTGYSGGRRVKHDLKGAWKFIQSNTSHSIFGWSSVNRYLTTADANTPPGSIVCGSNWDGTSVGSGAYTYPMVMFSLSGVANKPGAGSVVSNSAGWWFQRPGASSTYIQTVPSTNYIQPLKVSSTPTEGTSFPLDCDQLDSAAIKMVLYGCLARPTQYKISIIQLMEPYLHPSWLLAQSNLQGPDALSALSFYEELSKKFDYSPASFSDPSITKGKIKYIKTWTHNFEPRQSIEAPIETTVGGIAQYNSLPHSRVFNIFHKFNRKQTYNWQDQGALVEQSGNLQEPTPTFFGQNRTDVTYKARLYLLVQTLSPCPSVGVGVGQGSINMAPSFDISMRLYHSKTN